MVSQIKAKIFPAPSGKRKTDTPVDRSVDKSVDKVVDKSIDKPVDKSVDKPVDLFLGKYRGKVLDHRDPLGIGRLLVIVPAIPEENRRNWAMPCVPYAGTEVGFFALPPIGANVWVEFEEGNPNRPIWCGCFWEEGEVPESRPEKKVFRTAETAITLEDTPGRGKITLETAEGVKIVLSPAGIELSSGEGSIRLEGKKVSVNGRVLDGI